MALTKVFVAMTLLAVSISSTLAVEFVVGHNKGWTINLDYQKWVEGKEFHVGDKLVFMYTEGAHNVLKVNVTIFEQCLKLVDLQAFTSGNDVIPLTTLGRKWHICGVAQHCEAENQKLAITIWPEMGSPKSSIALSPTTTSSAGASISPSFDELTVALVTLSATMLV